MYRREKANVADTTGAGDTLNGAFALQRAKGADMETALRYANVAASLSTEKSGDRAECRWHRKSKKNWKNWEEEHETTGDFKQ